MISIERHMTIDWASFTPASAVMGGVIIGLAVALFALVSGRIAGISRIGGGLLRPAPGDVTSRLAFVAGLLAAALCFRGVAKSQGVVGAGYPTWRVAVGRVG